MNHLARISIALIALVFAGCAAEETSPEEKGSSTSNLIDIDPSDLPPDNTLPSIDDGPSPELLELQRKQREQEELMNWLTQLQRARDEAADNTIDNLGD